MALLDFLKRKNKSQQDLAVSLAPVIPTDIYAAGELDLADTIAPAALKVEAIGKLAQEVGTGHHAGQRDLGIVVR